MSALDRLNFMYLILLHGDNPMVPAVSTRDVYIKRENAEAALELLNRDIQTGYYSIQELIVQDNL